MSGKTEITKAMIARYIEAAGREVGKIGGWQLPNPLQERVTRIGLEAALNAPAKDSLMTGKVEITDEMVRRAEDAWVRAITLGRNIVAVRNALEAALNPPPDPEIPVTFEQTQAGLWALYHEDECRLPEPPIASERRHQEMARAYRAMRRLETR
jgi:hypothetical protein